MQLPYIYYSDSIDGEIVLLKIVTQKLGLLVLLGYTGSLSLVLLKIVTPFE